MWLSSFGDRRPDAAFAREGLRQAVVIVFVVSAVAVLAVLVTLHWYVWRRLIRETSPPRSVHRRIGNAVFVAAPVLTIGSLAGGSAGVPFVLQRVIAWPGDLWPALFLLSGHTHGGRLWPGNLLAELANPPVAAGLERYGDTPLYVSRGAGAWARRSALSDITVVELASKQA